MKEVNPGVWLIGAGASLVIPMGAVQADATPECNENDADVNSLECGRNSDASGAAGATAIGANSLALGDESTAMGEGAIATGDQATAIGEDATAIDADATAIGNSADASAEDALAVGADSFANGVASVVCEDTGGSYEPILIDIVDGWNILGYTLPVAQDVAATVEDIVDNILIIKDNDAEVYWPAFGFNGIGNFTPGQGYQVKTQEVPTSPYTVDADGVLIPDYQWPILPEGARIDMSPTVPQWAIDMPAEIHPNDIRTIVRVVNLLGQEVDLDQVPVGTTLIYLYNDGSVEKKM